MTVSKATETDAGSNEEAELPDDGPLAEVLGGAVGAPLGGADAVATEVDEGALVRGGAAEPWGRGDPQAASRTTVATSVSRPRRRRRRRGPRCRRGTSAERSSLV